MDNTTTADARIPVTEELRDEIRDKKPPGVTYDYYLRQQLGVGDE